MTVEDLVLGIHPFAHGFGWILFERPSAPLDWGVVEKRRERNAQCQFAIERIVERYQPAVVVLEAYDQLPTVRATSVRHLCRNVVSLVEARNIQVFLYSRADVRAVFASVNASTRHEIATAIAHRVEAIRERLPKKRAVWESEKSNMALFNAAAVALTHYALDSEIDTT